MDINQQLEHLNLSADILTENDVIDTIKNDATKLVTSQGIYNALQRISAAVSDDYSNKKETAKNIYDLSTQLKKYYALSSEVSSKEELSYEFDKQQDEITKNKNQIKYITNQISTKTQLLTKFNSVQQDLNARPLKTEVSSSKELQNKFDFVQSDIDLRALSSEVSSKEELQAKFDKIQQDISLNVRKDISSEISARVNILGKTTLNSLSVINDAVVNFANLKNNNPQLLLSGIFAALDGDEPIGIIFSKVNELIIDAELPIELLDITAASPSNIYKLYDTINQICKITHVTNILCSDNLSIYPGNINASVSKLQPDDIRSYNVQQVLSALSKKIKLIQEKNNYNTKLLTNMMNMFESSYSKSQTSSAYELKKAFQNKQNSGKYLTQNELDLRYVKKEYGDQTYLNTNSKINEVVNSKVTFNKDITSNSTLNANRINIDLGNLYDCKRNECICLDRYLTFLYSDDELGIAVRINEIINYCQLQIPLITYPLTKDKYNEVVNATNKICLAAKIKGITDGASYFEIENKLNLAITRLEIKDGMSLQRILVCNQLMNSMQSQYIQNLQKTINSLSSQCMTLSSQFYTLVNKLVGFTQLV